MVFTKSTPLVKNKTHGDKLSIYKGKVQMRLNKPEHIITEEQLGDILTKPLGKHQHQYLLSRWEL